MQPLRKFAALAASERRLLLSAALWLLAMRIALAALPWRTLLRHFPQVAPQLDPGDRDDGPSAVRLGWGVRVASRYVPWSSNCLVQALAAQRLLAGRGHPARLRIGVARDEAGRWKAHAWVESAGKIVIGGGRVSGYTPLASFQAPHPEWTTVFPGQRELSEVRGRDLP